MSHNGRGVVFHTLVLLAFLGVVLSTGWTIFWAGFTIAPDGPSPEMLRQEALAAAIGCALMAVAAVPLQVARADRWILVMDIVLVAVLGGLAVFFLAGHAGGQEVNDGSSWRWVVWMFAVTPTTWPIVVLLLATPVLRGWFRRAPRSLPVQ